MRPSLRHRLTLVLALFAWAAQLCLPVAHAAAASGGGAVGTCGASGQLKARLAQLPPELRSALAKAHVHADDHATCMQFCSAASGGAAPAAPTVVLREAGIERTAAIAVPQAAAPLALSPPARGPPSFS